MCMSAVTMITATALCWITASLVYVCKVSAIRFSAAGSLPPCFPLTGNWKPPYSTGQFIIAEAATRFFKAQGIQKLPASKTLQAEIEQLMREKNSLYNEYREKRERTKELQTVKSNIDQILHREPERGKGRENER